VLSCETFVIAAVLAQGGGFVLGLWFRGDRRRGRLIAQAFDFRLEDRVSAEHARPPDLAAPDRIPEAPDGGANLRGCSSNRNHRVRGKLAVAGFQHKQNSPEMARGLGPRADSWRTSI
jgi:hypothetical protein